jgi:hypothetical protein
MLSPQDQADIEAAVRSGINRAYRHGINTAIKTLETFRGQSVDPDTLQAAQDELRRMCLADAKDNP